MTFDRLIVAHCAPTLADLKCSSLVCLCDLDSPCLEVIEKLNAKGISFQFLTNRRGIPLMFMYRRDSLAKALRETEAAVFLKGYGYDVDDLDKSIARLMLRFSECDFPHEIGFFLGYPARDVIGFINHKGENFLARGMWKVYDNVEYAEKKFRSYEKCKKVYLSCFEEGRSLLKLCV